MDVYEDMLQEIGVLPDTRHECHFTFTSKFITTCTICGAIRNLQAPSPSCCGEPMTQNQSGHVSCYHCARSQLNSELVWYWPYAVDGKRSNSGYTFTKKRPYKKEQYFMTHLKRYLGHVRSVPPAPWITSMFATVDVLHPDAYFAVRHWLLTHRKTQHYSQIFSLIYANGGKQPDISPQAYTQLQKEIKCLCHYFFDRQVHAHSKKSMKCVPAMLHHLLLLSGHRPHYTLHRLKDTELLQKVDQLFTDYKRDVVDLRYSNTLDNLYRHRLEAKINF